VVLDFLAWNPVLLWAPAGMIGLSALAGIVPALKAYRTDVAANLAPID
jgi:putative ABC transport system permease protein